MVMPIWFPLIYIQLSFLISYLFAHSRSQLQHAGASSLRPGIQFTPCIGSTVLLASGPPAKPHNHLDGEQEQEGIKPWSSGIRSRYMGLYRHRTIGAARFHQFLTITSFYAEHEGCKEKLEKLPQETHFLDGMTSTQIQINTDKSTGYSRREGDA